MDCNKVQEKLSCYLDGVLDEAMLEAVESHLKNCPECRMELQALQILAETAGEIEEVEPPAYLRSSIMEAVAGVQAAPTCDELQALFSEYIDGELPLAQASEVKQHVAACEACAQELEMLAQTVSLVGSIEEVEVPVKLHRQIVAATVGEKSSTLSRLAERVVSAFQPKTAGWAAAGAAAAVMVAVLVTNRPSPTPDVTAVKPAPPAIREKAPVAEKPRVAYTVPEPVAAPDQAKKAASHSPVTVRTTGPVHVAVHKQDDLLEEVPDKPGAVVHEPAHKPDVTAAAHKPEARDVKPVVQLANLTDKSKPEPTKAEVEAQIQAHVAEIESSAVETKREEPKPSLMKIAVAPRNPARDLHDWAQTIKQDIDAKREMRSSSTLRLLDKRF